MPSKLLGKLKVKISSSKELEEQLIEKEPYLDKWLNLLPVLLNGIPYKIAGGYARDKYLGIPPKDIDVFIHYEKDLVKNIAGMLSNLGFSYETFGDLEEGFTEQDANDYGAPIKNGVSNVIKIGGHVDLIFVQHSLTNVCKKFDYNLNQFELNVMGKAIFKGKDFGILKVNNSKGISEQRADKIEKKAEKLGWSVDAVEYDCDY